MYRGRTFTTFFAILLCMLFVACKEEAPPPPPRHDVVVDTFQGKGTSLTPFAAIEKQYAQREHPYTYEMRVHMRVTNDAETNTYQSNRQGTHTTARYVVTLPRTQERFLFEDEGNDGTTERVATLIADASNTITNTITNVRASHTLFYETVYVVSAPSYRAKRTAIAHTYRDVPAGRFFQQAQRLATKENVLALTFDACGGKGSAGYDKELIDYLITNTIRATLFVNIRWLDANASVFHTLAKNPLFAIESHGLLHRPLSCEGRAIYGIKGTRTAQDVYDEVEASMRKLARHLPAKPRFFRPGTGWADEASLAIVRDLGYTLVLGNVVGGDYSKRMSAAHIAQNLLAAPMGGIVVLHMNHPDWNTKEGLERAVPALRARGVRFVHLDEYDVID